MTQEREHPKDAAQELVAQQPAASLDTERTTEAVEPPGTENEDVSEEYAGEGSSENEDTVYDEESDDGGSGFVRLRTPIFAVAATVASLVVLALIAGNVYQYVHNKDAQVVATVNGAPITQREFNGADAQTSQQILDSLINAKLADQAAQKAKLTIPNSEIDAQVNTIKKQLGTQQDYLAALKANNLTEAKLRAQIRTGEEETKLGAKGVTVTDAEAQAYYNQSKSQFGTQTFAQVEPQIKSQLLQSKQQQAVQTWIAGLRKNAKIDIHLPT